MKKNLRFLLALAIGWLTSTGAFALEQVEGVYQIGSADELIEFAGIVNGGENGANAVLTADIDMTDKSWTPIGDNDHRYIGTFDGQYHKIDNLKATGESKFGIFGVVNGGCVIKNLIAGPGNEIKGTSMIGGIIGASDGSGWVTLENVGHEGYVEGTGNNCCAIFGVIMNGGPATRMTNCYNTGNIKAGGESAIITGWFGGHGSVEVKGFWNTGVILAGGDNDNKALWRNNSGITKERVFNINDVNDATVITDEDLASGKLAYMLNGNANAGVWKQNLEGDSKDAYPTFIPTHGDVYANGALLCDGITAKEGSELTFSNTEGSTVDDHNYVDDICTVCNDLKSIDGVYQLSCADGLIRYSEIVRTTNGAANGVLTKDIDMQGKEWTPIGQDAHDFKGHFNGQGHRILNLTTSAGYNNQALFGQAVGGAIIENVIIDASCTIQGAAFTAGILGHVWGDGVIVRNCGNEADINGTAQNSAGIVGCSEKIVHILNCYNTGAIVGSTENAGICAWMGSNNSTIKNCWSTATGINGEAMWRKGEVQGENIYNIDGLQGTAFTEADLTSGKLAYMLNGNSSEDVAWYQKLGEEADAHPYPFGTAIVYANGSLQCDGITPKEGTELTFSNTEGNTVEDHTYNDWGFCSKCDAVQPDYMEPVDGAYQIGTDKQLNWFAHYAAKINAAANAVLTADIDMKDVNGFPGIANGEHPYAGTFNGQKHIIKNLTIDLPEEPNVGLFRSITNGAVIQNTTIDASCSFKGKNFAGAFVGHASGNGTARFEQLGNEADVTTVNQNAGAILGCNTSGELKLTFVNCYNAGVIASGNEAGALSGWSGNNAVMENCYDMGTVVNGDPFVRGNSVTATNCFDADSEWDALNKVAQEDFTNGTVLAKLQEAAPYIWYSSAAENGHPVLYKTEWGAQTVSDYAGVEVQEGEEFYLYNVASGLWLQENNRFTADWNTHGELGTVGFDVKLIQVEGGWQIDPKFGHNNSMNGGNQYLDTGDAVTAWTFEPVDIDGVSKTYYIKSGSNFLRAGNNDKLECTNNASKNVWQIVTRQQRLDYAKTATKANPKDVSFLIRANEFTQEDTRKSLWTLADNDNGGENWTSGRFDGDNRQNSVFEAWDMTKMNLSQTISGLPAGYYEVEARASESPTSNGGVTRALLDQYNAGTLEQYGVLYANTVTAKLPSIYSEQYSERTGHYAARNLDGIWMIDGVNQFSYAVANKESAYKVVTEPVEVAEDGSITLGVKVENGPEKTIWVMADKFRLHYLGTTLEVTVDEYLPVLDEAISNAEAFDASSTTDVLAAALATAINDAKAARTATTVAEMEAAIDALNKALEDAKSINVTILKKTIALAADEGIDVTAANTVVAEATTVAPVDNALNALRLARRLNAVEKQENVFKGNEPAGGDFYLYNVGAQRYLCGGDDWGAHAAVGFPGQLCTLVPEGESFKINSHLANGDNSDWLGYNGYMDTNSQALWTLLPVSEGVYAIARTENNSQLLGYDASTYNVVHSDRADSSLPENQWILVSIADRDAQMEKATETNPVDVSYKIQAPGFDQRAVIDKWEMKDFSIYGRGGNHTDFACESWDKETNQLSQTIEGLAPGKYEISVQGYFRDGNGTNQSDIIENGGEAAQLAKFYAGDVETLLPNIITEKDKAPGLATVYAIGEYPDGCDAACSFFQLGLYKTKMIVEVGESGTLTIGVKKDSRNFGYDWVVVDNFRLRFLGDGSIKSMSILGDFTGGWEFGEGQDMTQSTENPAIWTLAINDFEVKYEEGQTERKYEYKATANHTWGIYELPASGNQDWIFGETRDYKAGVYDLLFTVDTENHTLTLVPTFDEIASSINEMNANSKQGTVYNLNGQRLRVGEQGSGMKVEKAQKGLYIVNGRVVVVK